MTNEAIDLKAVCERYVAAKKEYDNGMAGRGWPSDRIDTIFRSWRDVEPLAAELERSQLPAPWGRLDVRPSLQRYENAKAAHAAATDRFSWEWTPERIDTVLNSVRDVETLIREVQVLQKELLHRPKIGPESEDITLDELMDATGVPSEETGVWVIYNPKDLGYTAWPNEMSALRYAAALHGLKPTFTEYGDDLRDQG